MKVTYLGRTTLVVTAIVSLCAVGFCKDRKPTRTRGADHETVEMFKAMDDGTIDVDFIYVDPSKATIVLRNKTKKPLSIKLPEAFAGVPVLKQLDGGGGGGGGQAGGGGGGGDELGGGEFYVAPEKVRNLKVAMVCLEHGKPDPNPRMKYEIKPIEAVTENPQVIELCKMLGRGKIPQNAAQASAWHLMSGLSWQELAAKDKFRSQFHGGYARKWFTPRELMLAQRIVKHTAEQVKKAPKDPPSERRQYPQNQQQASQQRVSPSQQQQQQQ